MAKKADPALKALTIKATEAATLVARISKGEELLTALKVSLRKLQFEDMPVMMFELELREIVLNSGGKFKVKSVISGSLPSAGAILKEKDKNRMLELKRRLREGLSWLRKNNARDLIKNEVTCSFASGEEKFAKSIAKLIRAEGGSPITSAVVHSQTLNKFLRETIEEGREVPVETFKLFTGSMAEYVPPKKK